MVKNNKSETMSESDFRQLLFQMPFGFVLFEIISEPNSTIDYKFIQVNPAYEKLLNIPAKDVIGKSIFSLFPHIGASWFEQLDNVATSQEPIHFVNYCNCIRKFLVIKAFMFNQHKMAVFIQDVTKQKRAEEKAKDRQKRIQSMFKAAPVGFGVQINRTLSEINETLCEITQFKRSELFGQSSRMLYADEKEFHWVGTQTIQQLSEIGCSSVETRWRRKDGSDIDVLISCTPLEPGKINEGLVFTVLDISKRKRVEQQLIDSKLKLKIFNDELLQVNKILQDINQDLKNAKEKAEENDKLKTAFLQNISHEIRTPMNAILGFSQLMKRHVESTNVLKSYIDIINREGNSLLKIVEEVLEISLIETGQTKLFLSKCKLNRLFQNLHAVFSNYITNSNKNITLRYIGVPSQEETILTDEFKLNQIFSNLIENAIKYSESGVIEYGVQNITKSKITFYVSDNGIGIPAEKFADIFERFVQIEPKDKIREGLGLGLSIAKGMVKILGGDVWLKSKINTGSTFYFTIRRDISLKEIKNNIYS
jgi:PAS domain S-box-containing protein